MENKVLAGAAIAFMLVGFVIGVPVGKGCKKCPEIIVGTETTTVVIVDTADTIVTVKDSSEIKIDKRVVKRRPVPITNKPEKVPVEVEIETTCFSWDENQEDGAYVECTLCSDSLPVSASNSQGEIAYKAPPETLRTITRIDTVREEVTKPIHKDWKTYVFGAIVAVLAGLMASQ